MLFKRKRIYISGFFIQYVYIKIYLICFLDNNVLPTKYFKFKNQNTNFPQVIVLIQFII